MMDALQRPVSRSDRWRTISESGVLPDIEKLLQLIQTCTSMLLTSIVKQLLLMMTMTMMVLDFVSTIFSCEDDEAILSTIAQADICAAAVVL